MAEEPQPLSEYIPVFRFSITFYSFNYELDIHRADSVSKLQNLTFRKYNPSKFYIKAKLQHYEDHGIFPLQRPTR